MTEAFTNGAGLALNVDSLTAGYGDLMAVRSVSLSVARGELLTVLGRNGAGKTSTLLAIAGMLKAHGGRVILFGEDVTGSAVQARIKSGLACVQEGRRIFRRRTVEENLLIATVPMRLSRRDRGDQLEVMYGRFPILAEKRTETADRLSGGQQQLLAIAQALMSSPKVLLLDEPSAGLAPAVLDSVMQTIRDLKSEGLAVVLVEQLVTRAVHEADFVAILDGGRIVHYGKADDTDALEVAREVYMAQKPTAPSARKGGVR
jgi:branched-chain amino acid transport system ATP-binding protein